jgi:FkbM family methyltransferase
MKKGYGIMKDLVLPNGEKIYYIDKLSALDIYEEIYVENDYLQFEIKVNDNDVIFDVGANIGLFSRFIAQQARDLTIFAFEPVPIIYEVLEANLKNIPAKIKTYKIGLADHSETTKIHYYPRVSADSAIVPFDFDLKVSQFFKNYNESIVQMMPMAKYVPKFLRKYVVKAGLKRMYKSEMLDCILRPLSDIISENGVKQIDLLKIDAENYEWEVLQGINEEDWNKIKQISMEIHTHIKGGENLLENIKKLLEEKEFSFKLDMEGRFAFGGVYMIYAKKNIK